MSDRRPLTPHQRAHTLTALIHAVDPDVTQNRAERRAMERLLARKVKTAPKKSTREAAG